MTNFGLENNRIFRQKGLLVNFTSHRIVRHRFDLFHNKLWSKEYIKNFSSIIISSKLDKIKVKNWSKFLKFVYISPIWTEMTNVDKKLHIVWLVSRKIANKNYTSNFSNFYW